MVEQKQQWDARSWSILLVCVGTCLPTMWLLLSRQAFVESGLRHLSTPVTSTAIPVIGVVSALFLLFVLPIVLSLTARKRPFIWGVAPGVSGFMFRLATFVNSAVIQHSKEKLLLKDVLTWLLTITLPALVGYGIRRLVIYLTAKKRAATAYELVSSPSQWPPAPRL